MTSVSGRDASIGNGVMHTCYAVSEPSDRLAYFTRTDRGTLGTADILPPLPFATFCIQTQRIALRLGMRGKATASPIVVMRPLTVWPNQRIGSASPLNFPLEPMGSHARGQDHALMHPPA